MRGTALILALALLTAGCVGGSDDGPDDEATATSAPGGSGQAATGNGSNATENATYLKNEDYNQTHVHDYWPGNTTTKVLMDEVLETNTFANVFYTGFSPLWTGEPRTSVGTVWFTLPNGSFVPEGTGELTVEVDATSALDRGEITLFHTSPNTDQWTEMDPQGAQAEWTIPLEPEMADLPHASSTQWYWRIEAQGNAAIMDGELNVKVIAHKLYDLDAWPEHDDPWEQGARTQLPLFTAEDTFDRTGEVTWIQTGEENPDAIRPPEGTIVPPETKIVLVKLWYALDGGAKNNANADVTLSVKEGSSAGWYRGMWDDQVEERDGFKMFAIEASSGNWDSPYADQSGWAWTLEAPSGLREPTSGDTFLYMGGTDVGSGNYTMDVTAYRELPGWLQGQIQEGED